MGNVCRIPVATPVATPPKSQWSSIPVGIPYTPEPTTQNQNAVITAGVKRPSSMAGLPSQTDSDKRAKTSTTSSFQTPVPQQNLPKAVDAPGVPGIGARFNCVKCGVLIQIPRQTVEVVKVTCGSCKHTATLKFDWKSLQA